MFVSTATKHLRKQTAKQTDTRVKLMNEVLAGMKVIKSYTWEDAFRDVIAHVRATEVNYLRKSNYIKGSTLSFYFVSSAITMLVTFVPYRAHGHLLTAYNVFTCYAYFNAMRRNMALFIALGIHSLVEVGLY